MKVRAPSRDGRYFDVQKLVHGLSLNTICEEARCPNISECWGRGTATFQILGDTCTRACRYCYVHSGRPESPPDALEPLRVAQAAAQMELKHVVVTSVDRDDVPDRGAAHYAATIRALKAKLPDASVEVLTPDFLGVEEEALQTVIGARPDVFNHNIETVRRIHPNMRGAKASYDTALWLLRRAKEIADYAVLTKSGIIVGLGETNDEVVETTARPARQRRRRRDHRPVPPAEREARAHRPLGAPGRIPLVPRTGRGARLRLRFLGPARALELPRRRAAPRRTGALADPGIDEEVRSPAGARPTRQRGRAGCRSRSSAQDPGARHSPREQAARSTCRGRRRRRGPQPAHPGRRRGRRRPQAHCRASRRGTRALSGRA